jgi:hypothetical protein
MTLNPNEFHLVALRQGIKLLPKVRVFELIAPASPSARAPSIYPALQKGVNEIL